MDLTHVRIEREGEREVSRLKQDALLLFGFGGRGSSRDSRVPWDRVPWDRVPGHSDT